MDLSNKAAIGELLARSAFGLDMKDLSLLEACFTDDARFSLAIEGVADVSEFNGREEIMGLFSGALDAQTDERKHVISNVWYSEEGSTAATVLSYLSLFATENGQTQLITTGLYTDRVVKSAAGDWSIAHRDLKLDRPY
ncbi:MAG: nuclear transport factor 2 family protein [Pseudomonadales bacterium]